MVLDHQPQGVGLGAVQPQPPGDAQGDGAADLLVVSGAEGFAGIVQEESQVKQKNVFDLLRDLGIGGVRRGLGVPDVVELFDADQRVFVGRVLMVELVLHKAGEAAEFRQELPQQAHLMHRPQHGGDVAPLVEDLQERCAHPRVAQERLVDQRKLVANELRHGRMEL